MGYVLSRCESAAHQETQKFDCGPSAHEGKVRQRLIAL